MKPIFAFMAAVTLLTVAACNETTTEPPVVQPPVVPPPESPTLTVAHVEPVYPLNMLGFLGSPVYPEPRVRVVDAYYKPIAGVRVAFEVSSGSGSLGRAEALTNGDGMAGVDFWKLGDVVVNTLVARVGNLSVTFKAFGLDPNEQPVARYDLVSVSGRPVPYSSGWNDLDAITDLGGTLELYSHVFVETFSFKMAYGDGRTFNQYVAGTYARSTDGFRLEDINVDAMLRGDSLIVGPQKMPDEIVAPSLYLKQKQ
jgi:hypothetical protein